MLEAIKASVPMEEDDGDPLRTPEQRHLMSGPLPIRRLLEFLADVSSDDGDQRAALSGAMLQLDAFGDQAGRTSRIVLMSKGALRERTVTGGSVELFQGRNPRKDVGKLIYPGDREIKVHEEPTLQVHVLRARDGSVEDVPTFALWVPKSYAIGTLVQPDG